MATQYDPIAKDESLNTTEATPRNIADVLAEELRGIASALTPAQLASLADVTISSPSDGQTLKYDAVSQKWVNANDAGGHTIENPSGTDMTQRTNLQFADAHLTDDSVNDRTEVEVIEEVDENGWASATEDGLYHVDDNGSTFVPITGNEIAYDANTSVNEKIDELDEGITKASRTVTKQSGFSGTATLTDCVGGFGFANLGIVSTNSLTANTQTNIAIDTATDTANGSFVAKITDSGGVVKGFAGVFIVTVGTNRYLQVIPNVTVPASGQLIGSGLYRYE